MLILVYLMKTLIVETCMCCSFVLRLVLVMYVFLVLFHV